MNRILFILFLTFNLSGFSQTQAEMNKEAFAEFKESDKQLNEIYKTILSQYNFDTLFVQYLKKSQRIWIQFRDAEMLMKFPDYSDRIYGSIQPTCRSYYIKELTDNRIETLKNWVTGGEEGNACSGSVRIIEEIFTGDMGFAYIGNDSIVFMSSNMKIGKEHRIFGYLKSDISSKKMILLSIFTSEVKNNPFNCKYGAFYETIGMHDLSLKYLRTKGDFLEIAIIKEQREIDKVYMLKKWFEFEEK